MLDLLRIKTPRMIRLAPANHLEGKGSSNRKYPASPDEMKLAAKFVTVAWRDDKALRLLT